MTHPLTDEERAALEAEAEWSANERRLAIMCQCGDAAANKALAESRFVQEYPPPPCDFPDD